MQEWIGDRTCNPYLNNAKCEYDGGDCCQLYIDDTLCHPGPGCNCHLTSMRMPSWEEVYNTTCSAWPFMKKVHDKKCHDELNNMDCNYDMGACCYPQIDDTECQECFCHDDNTRHSSF